MQRFYIPGILEDSLILEEKNIYHQLTRVLRIKTGEDIIFFNPDIGEIIYRIEEIGKRSIYLKKVSASFPKREGKKDILLFQALPNKYEKIEYIIQKGVEVGVGKFVFFRSDFSQKLILSPSKIERFHTILREALEQCGGIALPELVFLDHMPDASGGRVNITLDTTGQTTSISKLSNHVIISLWVGPEGGWSDKERENMISYGFIFARLGERVLRTETAGPVTTFALQNA